MYDIGLVQFDKMALWGLQPEFLRPIAGSEITCGSGFTCFTLDSDMAFSTFRADSE